MPTIRPLAFFLFLLVTCSCAKVTTNGSAAGIISNPTPINGDVYGGGGHFLEMVKAANEDARKAFALLATDSAMPDYAKLCDASNCSEDDETCADLNRIVTAGAKAKVIAMITNYAGALRDAAAARTFTINLSGVLVDGDAVAARTPVTATGPNGPTEVYAGSVDGPRLLPILMHENAHATSLFNHYYLDKETIEGCGTAQDCFDFMAACVTKYYHETARGAGRRDVTFHGNGVNVTLPADGGAGIFASTLQADGKLVTVGQFQDSATNTKSMVAFRYNVDGTTDATFGAAGRVTLRKGTAMTVMMQTVGGEERIVIGGASAFGTSASQTSATFARLHADGTLDASFGNAGYTQIVDGATTVLSAIAMQGEKIVGIGYSDVLRAGINDAIAVRLNADGTRDTTWGNNSGYTIIGLSGGSVPRTLAVTADGKLVFAGCVYENNKWTPMIARLNADGRALDTSFGYTGSTAGYYSFSLASDDGELRAIKIQPDGKIIAAAIFSSTAGTTGIVRLTSNGRVDTSFGDNGSKQTALRSRFGDFLGLAIADNRIYEAASTMPNGKGFGVAALDLSTGNVVTSFGDGGKTFLALDTTSESRAFTMQAQSDGKLVVAGVVGTSPAAVRLLAR